MQDMALTGSLKKQGSWGHNWTGPQGLGQELQQVGRVGVTHTHTHTHTHTNTHTYTHTYAHTLLQVKEVPSSESLAISSNNSHRSFSHQPSSPNSTPAQPPVLQQHQEDSTQEQARAVKVMQCVGMMCYCDNLTKSHVELPLACCVPLGWPLT